MWKLFTNSKFILSKLKGNPYKLGEKQKRRKAVVGMIGFDTATWGIQAFNDFLTHFISEVFASVFVIV